MRYVIDTTKLMENLYTTEDSIQKVMDATSAAMEFVIENVVRINCENLYLCVEDNVLKLYNFRHLVLSVVQNSYVFSEMFEKAIAYGTRDREQVALRVHYKVLLECMVYVVYAINKRLVKLSAARKGNHISYKIPAFGFNVYEHDIGDEAFIIEEKAQQIRLMANAENFRTYSIRGPLYPLPNSSAATIFHQGNTSVLINMQASDLLSEFRPQVGKCFQNAEEIYTRLSFGEFGKQHQIQYYAGWVYDVISDSMTYHAWVVMDGVYVIDPSFYTDNPLTRYYYYMKNGNIYEDISREKYAEWIKEHISNDRPFSSKYCYGQVADRVYIGVLSYRREASDMLEDLLKKHPQHPDYQNFGKDGRNALHRILQ